MNGTAVASVMTKDVVTVAPDTPFRELVEVRVEGGVVTVDGAVTRRGLADVGVRDNVRHELDDTRQGASSFVELHWTRRAGDLRSTW